MSFVHINHYTFYCKTLIFHVHLISLVAWLSGNALVSSNEVTLCQARLVLGWVTV